MDQDPRSPAADLWRRADRRAVWLMILAAGAVATFALQESLVWLACAALCAVLAARKNRSVTGWLLLSLAWFPIAVAIVVLTKPWPISWPCWALAPAGLLALAALPAQKDDLSSRSAAWKGLALLGLTAVLAAAFFVVKIFTLMSFEAATLRALVEMRGQLGRFSQDHKTRPRNLDALTADGRYLKAIPKMHVREHRPSAVVHYGKDSDDTGGWLYDNIPGDPFFGQIWINCTAHQHKSLGALGQAPASHKGWDAE